MTSENLKFNEVIQDTDSPEKKESEGGYGVEIVKGQDNSVVVESLQQLESAISHDEPVTVMQILDTEKSLDSMKVVVGGEEMTIGEMRQIPDLEKNAKIWEEIEGGDFSSHIGLTYVTPHVADLFLSKFKGNINLGSLGVMSDDVAERLSRYQGYLSLGGLRSISEVAAEYLSKHQGKLYLAGLSSMSDTAVRYLSKHEGDLFLNGLTSMSDAAAKYLSEHKGVLGLYGLVSISDTVAEHLSKNEGDLGLGGLLSISDKAAGHLSEHKGVLYLYGMTVISDLATEHLSKHVGRICSNPDFELKIDFFKNQKL